MANGKSTNSVSISALQCGVVQSWHRGCTEHRGNDVKSTKKRLQTQIPDESPRGRHLPANHWPTTGQPPATGQPRAAVPDRTPPAPRFLPPRVSVASHFVRFNHLVDLKSFTHSTHVYRGASLSTRPQGPYELATARRLTLFSTSNGRYAQGVGLAQDGSQEADSGMDGTGR